jgi:hypothetical protein
VDSASPSRLKNILAALAAAKVEYILVGGLAAVAQGAPLMTFDADIVHRRTPDNVHRLVDALSGLNARYRGRPAGEVLRPTVEILSTAGHSLLTTDYGPLDVLGAIEGQRGYDELIGHAIAVEMQGHPIQVLGLAMLAELKRGSTHAKDRASLLVLEDTLRRRGG